jgi:hypothetical protein
MIDTLFDFVYWSVITIALCAMGGITIVVAMTAYRVYLEAKEDRRNDRR